MSGDVRPEDEPGGAATAPIAVVGAGAFGTALAAVIARSTGDTVTLLARDAATASQIAASGENARYLSGIALPEAVAVTADPARIAAARIVLLAVPSGAQGAVAASLAGIIRPDAAVVICAKGLDRASGALLSDVVAQALPGRAIAVLSGPGFAADIARGLPTAMTLAAARTADAERLAAALSGATFRLYASADLIGVQLCGALKNVLAIACGIVEGAGLGESARAALIARGLAELARFVVAEGGQAETVSGLAGLGDLVLTATSHQSRNLAYGIALGAGRPQGEGGPLVEGASAAALVNAIADRKGIAMPITAAVSDIITGRLSVGTALSQLMNRPLRAEHA